MDYHTDETYPQMIDALGLFRSALAKYRQRDWAKARKLFEEVLQLNPHDEAAALYILRCEHMAAHPPSEGWDGTTVMTAK